MQVLSGFSVDGGGRRKAGSRPFHGGNTGSSPVGRANARFPFGLGSKATRQARLPSAAADRLRLLGQLRAGYHARGLRPVHVAPLHAVWRQDRADRIAIVVDYQNRVVTRDRGDELFVAARRRKRASKPAAVLLVDGHGESNAVEARLGR